MALRISNHNIAANDLLKDSALQRYGKISPDQNNKKKVENNSPSINNLPIVKSSELRSYISADERHVLNEIFGKDPRADRPEGFVMKQDPASMKGLHIDIQY